MGKSEDKLYQDKPAARRFISLRWLATLAAAGLVAVTVAVVGWVSEKNMRQALVREAQTQLVLEARNLAITSSDALLTEFPELTLIPLAKDIQNGRPEILNVVITNHQGLIQGSPESRATGTTWQKPADLVAVKPSTQLEKNERLSESGAMIMVECPVRLHEEQDIGWVIIVLDKSFIESKLQKARTTLLTFALVLLVASVLLSAILMSNLFKPLSQLRAGLERIGRGDLDSPMQVRDITELGLLSDTVNSMSSQLKASQNLAQAREQEVVDTQKEVIITLGQVVEGRSSETANHTLRVGDMSYELAILADLAPEEAELIRMASPMHDVGKIGIPDSILNKPGKLTDEEYKTMQNHAEIGFTILNKSERSVLRAAATIAHEHHERWDGKGYPRKIRGEDIHLYGRIVSLVDVFDAIFSDRVYRKAMPLEKVLSIINEERGKSFEPRLVDLFLANLPKFLAISERYQDQVIEKDPVVSTPEPKAVLPLPSGVKSR